MQMCTLYALYKFIHKRKYILMAAFKGASVFITGCNRGIGLGLVKHLLSLDESCSPRRIFATCRSTQNARELNELAAQHKQVLHIVELDVNNATQLASVVEKVVNEAGKDGLNVLINNAGIYDLKNTGFRQASFTLDEVTPELMLKVYETNTVAPLMITKAFLPLLKQAAIQSTSQSPAPQHPSALVVNVSSGAGSFNISMGGSYQYNCSKAALNMVSKCLSVDLAKYGITVVALRPGWIKTDMGGPNATHALSEIIPTLVNTIGSLDKSHSGSFVWYNGDILPW